MMSSKFAALIIGLTIGLAVGLFVRQRAKQRRADELIQHPERLEQNLDPTDDA